MGTIIKLLVAAISAPVDDDRIRREWRSWPTRFAREHGAHGLATTHTADVFQSGTTAPCVHTYFVFVRVRSCSVFTFSHRLIASSYFYPSLALKETVVCVCVFNIPFPFVIFRYQNNIIISVQRIFQVSLQLCGVHRCTGKTLHNIIIIIRYYCIRYILLYMYITKSTFLYCPLSYEQHALNTYNNRLF